MTDSFGAVILAAGIGKRLNLNTIKPLAPLMGRKLIDFPILALHDFLNKTQINGEISVVIGHQKERLESHLKQVFEPKQGSLNTVVQKEQLGTADALLSYFNGLPRAKELTYTLVMCGDTPIIEAPIFQSLFNNLRDKNLDAVAATFNSSNPTGYGRIVRAPKGFNIVEEKDANETIKSITEVNSGLYIFKTPYVLQHLSNITTNNQSKEFYLTDLFQDTRNVEALCFPESQTFIGVNDLSQLETCEMILKQKKMKSLQTSGVRFIDLRHTYVDHDAKIEQGVTVYPNAFILGKSKIAEGSTIGPGSIIINSVIESNVEVKAYSHIEDSIIRASAVVGPYARLRPQSDIGSESKIGNFVEVKKAKLDRGVKVSHLSYIGDAEIGENTNIGCGFISCNFDGAKKHKTIIGKNTYIGADSQTIAPVEIGNDCYVACSSTINRSMPDNSFAISRPKQSTKVGMAAKFLKRKP